MPEHTELPWKIDEEFPRYDLSKKYRTRRGGEVFGLCLRDGGLYGFEYHRAYIDAHSWNTEGMHVCGFGGPQTKPDYDLIEVRKLRQWVLTETGESRTLKRGEYGFNGLCIFRCDAQESFVPHTALSIVEREIEEPQGNG